MNKKLSIAFIWHMHQPPYVYNDDGEYLMPWVRFHAIKDYLDMALILDKHPKIKQTFNLGPSLIDQLIDYGHNNAQDRHLKLTLSDVETLSRDDKAFILDNFFDANYDNMIFPHEPFRNLYEKRNSKENIAPDEFSNQEYSDIMALFNLIWFDPQWVRDNEKLNGLYNKGYDYTLEDRIEIVEIQREIIRNIIPKYKELFEKGQIEISTNPYYHPILPLLINQNSAKEIVPGIQLPENKTKLIDDAKKQIKLSIEKFESLFGQKPQGIWSPEHCVSNDSLELLGEMGVRWTVTDEGILSNALNKNFERTFHGDLQDPYELSRVYKFERNNKSTNILFRDSLLTDLIAFEYGDMEPEFAANDLYERIKNIQNKLQTSPDNNHVVTIALDGENCWESYRDDGVPFLNSLYDLLSSDESLSVCTVSEAIDKVSKPPVLNSIKAGSWVNRSLQLWIGDPIKNQAWEYLKKAREELIHSSKHENFSEDVINRAWKEIYIAEGSDWFWWYGEPNDSGQDDLFDELFRMHLKNVYKLLGKPIPEYLEGQLSLFSGEPSRIPKGLLDIESDKKWDNAGFIEIPEGPMYKTNKFLKKIYFGNDKNNIYFKFDLIPFELENAKYRIHVYAFSPEQFKALSPIRLKTKGNMVYTTQKYGYAYEAEIPIETCRAIPFTLSEAIDFNMWKVKKHYYNSTNDCHSIEILIPFDDLDISPDEEVYFVILTSKWQVIQEVIPKNEFLTLKRPNGALAKATLTQE